MKGKNLRLKILGSFISMMFCGVLGIASFATALMSFNDFPENMIFSFFTYVLMIIASLFYEKLENYIIEKKEIEKESYPWVIKKNVKKKKDSGIF